MVRFFTGEGRRYGARINLEGGYVAEERERATEGRLGGMSVLRFGMWQEMVSFPFFASGGVARGYG